MKSKRITKIKSDIIFTFNGGVCRPFAKRGNAGIRACALSHGNSKVQWLRGRTTTPHDLSRRVWCSYNCRTTIADRHTIGDDWCTISTTLFWSALDFEHAQKPENRPMIIADSWKFMETAQDWWQTGDRLLHDCQRLTTICEVVGGCKLSDTGQECGVTGP